MAKLLKIYLKVNQNCKKNISEIKTLLRRCHMRRYLHGLGNILIKHVTKSFKRGKI